MKAVEFKIYPTPSQARTLEQWMRTCCWIYNRALDMRTKAYKRRKESLSLYDQQKWLTKIRSRCGNVRVVPVNFMRDALRRVDRGMQGFFRRVKAADKPGFPRFKAMTRYNSMEFLEAKPYLQNNLHRVRVPKLGCVRCRGRQITIPKTQNLLRIIRRADGWYAQVVAKIPTTLTRVAENDAVGIDVGLKTFAATSDGKLVSNPRFARGSERKLKHAQRKLSRCQRGSRNRRKAKIRLQRVHERIARQRRNFCHRLSNRLVRSHRLIAVEKLNVKGLARTRMAKSIMDAGWSIFLTQLRNKAEDAGCEVIEVDCRGTSQTCPACGTVKKKVLSERVHRCDCGCVIDRDVAAAQIILARAMRLRRGVKPVGELVTTLEHHASLQTDSLMQAGI